MAHYRARARQVPPRQSLSPEVLEEVRLLYLAGEVPAKEISLRYGRKANWVNGLAAKHSWPTRKSLAKPAAKPPARGTVIDGRAVRVGKRPKPKSIKQTILDAKAAGIERERQLYGANAADVDFLRRRGFVVTREGAGYLVGNAQCTTQQMRAKADRERRLAGAPA